MWRSRGVNVRPVMDHPLGARNTMDFWHRWNTAFNDVAFRSVFRPTVKRFNSTLAIIATFLFSGLVHELVITIPARNGYGGPTAYFLIQSFAILLERKLKLRGPVARIFTWIVVLAPLALLFPEPFRIGVLRPFAHALAEVSPC